MLSQFTDEQLPFTPPPYYVAKKDLPKARARPYAAQGNASEAANPRPSPGIIRRMSSRKTSETEGQVAKSQKKKKKPGLSINTNVIVPTRTPQEIKPLQPVQKMTSNIPSFQPPQQISTTALPQYAQHEGQDRYSIGTNSPSRFPSTYLSSSRQSVQKTSPLPTAMFFAPPPGPSSSVYSRSARNSLFRGDSGKKAGAKKSQVRESNTTTFEEDFEESKVQGLISSGTTHEDHGPNTQAQGTANTATPHRSRGWWTVVTTPFGKTPTEDTRISRMSDFSASQYSEHEPQYPPVPVPPIPGQYKKHNASTPSLSSTTFSPGDREIPIALGGDLRAAGTSSKDVKVKKNVHSVSSSDSGTIADSAASNDRMPFADVGKSPATRLDDFSPSGMVAAEGVVPSSRGVVNNITINANLHHPQAMTAEAIQSRNSTRSSIHAAVTRTVRFITPRSSIFPPPPGQYTATRERFDPPPTPYYRRDSFNSFEELEFEDAKHAPQQKKKNTMACIPWFTQIKLATKKETKNDTTKAEKKKLSRRRKCCFCCLCVIIAILVLVILIIALAVTLSRKNHKVSSTSQFVWINTTNFPSLVTGTLTVARPNLITSQSGCVNPSTAWSCAVPKEHQPALAPNDPSQPNFLFSIKFDNSSGLMKRSSSGPANALHVLRARAFTASPPPASIDDQKFLGNTTDKNTTPFEGEVTPFYISFYEPDSDATGVSSKIKRQAYKIKRQAKPSQTVNVIPNIATNIPLPSLHPDGTPGPANLLPFPTDQQLRIYNRGRNDEHYGFYTYFERNIFLRSGNVQNMTGDVVTSDLNGGSTQDGANVRCTWSDTRFLVQIWTRRGTSQLLSKASAGSKQSGGDFIRPGSFPYPITVTLDRHGGGPNTKMLYCYGLDAKGRVDQDQRSFLAENRSFGGVGINPSTGPFTSRNPKISIAEGGPGGIDGGNGGCGCVWQNWS